MKDFEAPQKVANTATKPSEEKVTKALETRNNILEHMKNIDYSCEEYFENED